MGAAKRTRDVMQTIAGKVLLLAMGLALAAGAPDVVEAPGVKPHEIVLGTILDLSGPMAAQGQAIRDGLNMAFDRINAEGGVNGRRIALLVKDSGFDPGRAHAAATALINAPVFAVIEAQGTPAVAASIGEVLQAGRLFLFPAIPAEADYAPARSLEFSLNLPLAAAAQLGLRALLDRNAVDKVGVLYPDNSLGSAIMTGVTRELNRRRLTLAGRQTWRSGYEALRPKLAALRAAGVQIVVLGGIAQSALAALSAAEAMGWHPMFLCPACYLPEVATLGGRAAEGLYAFATVPIPYPRDANKALAGFARAYATRFQSVPSEGALRAFLAARLFAHALELSGSNPTPLHMEDVLEAMPPWVDPALGGVPVAFSRRDHLGVHGGWLARIVHGRWQPDGDIIALTESGPQ